VLSIANHFPFGNEGRKFGWGDMHEYIYICLSLSLSRAHAHTHTHTHTHTLYTLSSKGPKFSLIDDRLGICHKIYKYQIYITKI